MFGRVVACQALLAALSQKHDTVGALPEVDGPAFLTRRRSIQRGNASQDRRHGFGADDHAGTLLLRDVYARHLRKPGSSHSCSQHDRVARHRGAGKLNRGHPSGVHDQAGDRTPGHDVATHLSHAAGASLGNARALHVSVVVAVRGCLHCSGSETRFQTQHLGFVDHPCDVTPRLQPRHVPRQRLGILVGCRPGELSAPAQTDVSVEKPRKAVPGVERPPVQPTVRARLLAETVDPGERVAGGAHTRFARVDQRHLHAPRAERGGTRSLLRRFRHQRQLPA